MKTKFSVQKISIIGVMAALVFAASWISIPIAIPLTTEMSRIHLGNIACLLSGFLLGGVGGGLAAGIGSALYDLTNPIYFSSMPFTFVFKFLMAFICAKIAYSGGRNAHNLKFNILAAIAGGGSYVLLYVTKGFLSNILFARTEIETALIAAVQKFGISSINMIIACVISIPLAFTIKKLVAKARLDKLFQ